MHFSGYWRHEAVVPHRAQEPPGAHVLRLFLHPDQRRPLRQRSQRGEQLVHRQRVELLDADDRRRPSMPSSCRCAREVVVDLARAEEHAGIAFARVGWSTPAARRGSGRATAPRASRRTPWWRSRLLGVITTSGLRQRRSTCRRRQWKYCAGVVGLTTWMLSSAASVQEPLEPGAASARALGPSKPCGSSSTRPLSRRHLSSALAMNWSMITWAALAKSPNCASHSDEPVGAVEAVAVLEAEHARFRQRAVDDLDRRLVGATGGPAACTSCPSFTSCSTAWRWLNVPRSESCPLRRMRTPCDRQAWRRRATRRSPSRAASSPAAICRSRFERPHELRVEVEVVRDVRSAVRAARPSALARRR